MIINFQKNLIVAFLLMFVATAHSQTADVTSGSFTVGGASGSYYPVRFTSDIGPNTSDLVIYRSSVHENGTWFGTFNLVISFHPTDWGNFYGQIEKVIYQTGAGSPYQDPVGDINDGSSQSGGSDIVVWLKGGATYHWRNRDVTAGWALTDGNGTGGVSIDSSGRTWNPITVQSQLILNAKNRFYTNNIDLGTANNLYVGGSLGIGTIKPGANLEVNNVIKLTNSGSSNGGDDNDGKIGAGTFGPGLNLVGVATQSNSYRKVSLWGEITQQQNNGTNTWIGNSYFSGNVGIGTPGPNSTLQVYSNQNGISNVQGVTFTAGDLGINNSVVFNTKGSSGVEADRALINASGNGGSILYVRADGNVGIGTTSPGSTLEVSGNIALTNGKGGSILFQDGSKQSTAWTGSLCGGDYAESIDVSDGRKGYEPGDVLVIDPKTKGKFLKANTAYSTKVAGVYSTKPGVIGRRQTMEKSPDEIPMAIVGIVPTKVSAENGPIEPGDILVTSSTPGYAMKGTDHSRMFGAVIGKAMDSLDVGTGVIEVLVSLQ